MTKTALVTGASGFVGHHLCNRLHADGWNIIAVGTKEEHMPLCNTFLECSLHSIPWESIPNIDTCFHQAANNDTTDLDIEKMMQSNLHDSSELFHKLHQEKKCYQFVYASSCSIYGNAEAPYVEQKTKPDPLNPYALSKFLFEQFANKFAQENNVQVIGLRYSNVYGQGENHKGKRASMITQLLNKMLQGISPTIFKYGEQLRDWVYIEDVIEANVLSSRIKKTGVYNVGSGETLSFNQIVQLINEELGISLPTNFVDCPFPQNYQSHTLCDLTLSRNILNYKPKMSAEMSVRNYIKEIKKATACAMAL